MQLTKMKPFRQIISVSSEIDQYDLGLLVPVEFWKLAKFGDSPNW